MAPFALTLVSAASLGRPLCATGGGLATGNILASPPCRVQAVRVRYRTVGTDRDTLRARIARGRARLAEFLASSRLPPEAGALIHDAPAMLDLVDRSISAGEPVNLGEIELVLEKIDRFLEDAVRGAGGAGGTLGDRTDAGLPPDPSAPPHRRLAERLYTFVQRRLDPATFVALVREWAGEGAFQGNVCVADRAIMAELSVWLIYDRILPGHDRRAIDWFAEDDGKSLPEEEQALLRFWRQDRPSLYRIESIRPGKRYDARDLLADDVLRVRDWTNSRTLSSGAIVAARFAPYEGGTDYGALGPLTGVPRKVWPRLKEFVEELRAEYRKKAPGASTVAFFRKHHAQIRRRLYELTRA